MSPGKQSEVWCPIMVELLPVRLKNGQGGITHKNHVLHMNLYYLLTYGASYRTVMTSVPLSTHAKQTLVSSLKPGSLQRLRTVDYFKVRVVCCLSQ